MSGKQQDGHLRQAIDLAVIFDRAVIGSGGHIVADKRRHELLANAASELLEYYPEGKAGIERKSLIDISDLARSVHEALDDLEHELRRYFGTVEAVQVLGD